MPQILASPVYANGVIVYVNEDAGYAYLDASYFGRVLVHKFFMKNFVKVGSWFSLLIQDNRDLTLTADCTGCRFSDASELRPIQMLLSSATLISKTGVEQVRLCASVYIGLILPRGGIGLNSLFGRVFFSRNVIDKFELNALHWLKVSMVSADAVSENFFCNWEARYVETNVAQTEKKGIRVCRARCHKLVADNFCSLKLLDEDSGFAFAYATDFAEVVDQNTLTKNEIEVIACAAAPNASSVEVPICFAVLVGGGAHQIFLERELDLGNKKSGDSFTKILESGDAVAKESFKTIQVKCETVHSESYTPEKEMGKMSCDKFSVPEGICSRNCETIGIILEAMADKKFVEICSLESPELYEDLRAFVKQCEL